jgi:hypothetical protein
MSGWAPTLERRRWKRVTPTARFPPTGPPSEMRTRHANLRSAAPSTCSRPLRASRRNRAFQSSFAFRTSGPADRGRRRRSPRPQWSGERTSYGHENLDREPWTVQRKKRKASIGSPPPGTSPFAILYVRLNDDRSGRIGILARPIGRHLQVKSRAASKRGLGPQAAAMRLNN